jgi:NAD-dependent deacetylase
MTAMINDSGDDRDALVKAVALLQHAQRVAVLTGAGVSAESGVPTFRGSDGLWEGHRIDEVATPMAFRDDPRLVWRFYNLRRANLRTVQPNAGHLALAELERRFAGDHFTLITQNVDGLHRRAGSQRVLELHGNLARTRCTQCHQIEDRGLDELGELPHCPKCNGLLRPDIVWFHEALPDGIWEEAALMTSLCDVFLVVGTSAVVYPAAGLIVAAKRSGAKVIEVNLAETDASYHADVRLAGPSGVLLPKMVEKMGVVSPKR